MVDIGDCRSYCIANGFGVVESVVPRIRPGDKEPVDCMVGAMSKATSSQLVVPGIFMEQAGENCRGHIGADAVVGEGCAITFPVSVPSLSPLFWIILCLRDSRQDDVEGISTPIKNAGGRQSKFLAGGERRKMFGVFDGPVVRQNLEDTIIDGSGFFLELALPNRLAGFVFVLIFLPFFRFLRI